MWRDLIKAVSLANLVFMREWAELLTYDRRNDYWIKWPPTPTHFAALIVNILVLSVVFLAIFRRMREHPKSFHYRLAPVWFVLLLIALLNSLATLIGTPQQSLFLQSVQQKLPVIGVIVGIGFIVALLLRRERLLHAASAVLSATFLLVPLFFTRALLISANYTTAGANDGKLAARLPERPGAPRVFWVIFDEWDQQLTFRDRPTGLRLPEIDRFRATAFYASRVQRAAYATDWAMPALIMGRPVDTVKPSGPAELQVTFPGSPQAVSWTAQPNVFRDARQLGLNTGVLGWAVPYCRVLNQDLSSCDWEAGSTQYNSTGNRFGEILRNQPRELFETIYRSPFGQSLATKRHVRVYKEMMDLMQARLARPETGLVLIHLPVPHPPYFYNRATGRFDRGATPLIGIFQQTQQGYVDALELVDQTIGIIRRTLENSGEWDRTGILLSADHSYRHRPKLDGRPVEQEVPFLLKLAGQKSAVDYEAAFNAILTRPLLRAILSGEIAQPQDVPVWLSGHN